MNVKFYGVVLIALALIGGVAFLSIWQPQAPIGATEIPVPNERLSLQ